MSLTSLIVIPLLLGLVGFFEPCSLGINVIFLNRIKNFSRAQRIYETTTFTVVRAFFLALVGLMAAYIGGGFIRVQTSLFVILGGVYILLGILSIVNMYRPIFKQNINLAKYFKNKGALTLGILFGIIIPACAIVLIVFLITNAAVSGSLFEGFVSLFIFGLALSSPLIAIGYFKKSTEILQKIAMKTKKVPWMAGAIMIFIGLLTMLSSVWWSGVLEQL